MAQLPRPRYASAPMNAEGPAEGVWIVGRSDQRVPRRRVQPLGEPVCREHRGDRAKSRGRNHEEPAIGEEPYPKTAMNLGRSPRSASHPTRKRTTAVAPWYSPVDKAVRQWRQAEHSREVQPQHRRGGLGGDIVNRLTTPSSTTVRSTDRRISAKSSWPGARLDHSLR